MRSEERPSEVTTVDVVISSGQSLSAAANLGGLHAMGIIMPSAWTAASLSFQACADSVTFVDLYSEFGTEVVIPAGVSRFLAFAPSLFLAFNGLKVRSGTTGTPVNQAADRTLKIVARSF